MRAMSRLLRRLARRPGLTAARLATLTIVVASVTAALAVADTTLLRPLPFPHSSRLVLVYLQPPGTSAFRDSTPLDRWEFKRYHAEVQRMERLEGIEPAAMAVADAGEPESILGGRVSRGFFDLLGGTPALGRAFTPDEVAGNARLVVLGDAIWRRRYGGNPGIVGRAIRIDREPYTVIGVMRSDFEPAFTRTEFWTPLFVAQTSPAGFTSVRTIGRLPSPDAAADTLGELRALWTQMAAQAPALAGWSVNQLDLHRGQYGPRRAAAWMLLAAAIALMLLAAANLTNLTLADVLFRREEFALRAALGGSRSRIAQPEFVECVTLAGAGALLGLVGAAWLLPALLSLNPADTARDGPISIDWRIWAASLTASMTVMLSSAGGPVWRATGRDLTVGHGTRGGAGGRAASRIRQLLVAGQATLAVVLLATGALVVQALQRASDAEPGFDAGNVLTAQVRLTDAVLPTEVDRTTFVRRMLEEVRGTSGVIDAGITLNPFVANGGISTIVRIEDHPRPDGTGYSVQFRRVSPGYFEAMRIRLFDGRTLTDQDSAGMMPVAVVSRAFAKRFWADTSPVGRRIRRGSANVWQTIVGVVDDVRDVGLDLEPAPTVYTAYYQQNAANFPVALVVRTAGDPATWEPAVKRAIWAVDASQPLANVRTMQNFLDETLGRRRFRATLVAVFGLIGTLLATIGIYGVTARSIAERTREVGIRVALGGDTRAVWMTMAAASARTVAAGALVGVVLSMAAIRGLAALLPEITGPAWIAAALAGIVLAMAGVVTSMIAARRVLQVEPAQALRTQ